MYLFNNKRYLYIFLSFVLFVSSNQLNAQIISVFHGKLIDDQTSQPVGDAHIYSSSNHATVSEADGQFSILAKPSDTLTVSCMGYGKVRIYVSHFKDYENYYYTFRIKPTVYQLRTVEVPALNSLVILPAEVKTKVDVAGIEPINDNLEINVGPDVNVKLERPVYKTDLPYFGIGFTINGFISAFGKKESKEEKDLKARIEAEKGTELFYKYINSDVFKKVIMNNYKLTEDEYINFIIYFQNNAGGIKKSNNEYEILKVAIEKLPNFLNK